VEAKCTDRGPTHAGVKSVWEPLLYILSTIKLLSGAYIGLYTASVCIACVGPVQRRFLILCGPVRGVAGRGSKGPDSPAKPEATREIHENSVRNVLEKWEG